MNLYELTLTADYLQRLLEDGDIDEQTYADSFESLGAEEQVETACKIIRNLEAKAAAFKEEEQRLASKRMAAERGVERLKDSLTFLMSKVGDKKMDAGLFSVSLCYSTSVDIYRQEDLPEQFFVPQPDKIDKSAIGKALKAGEIVAGAELKKKPYVRIK